MPQMQASRNGALFIAAREALVLVAYPDPTWESPSNGFGHNDKTLKSGDTITIPQAFAQLKQDMSIRGADLNRWLEVTVSQTQFDALLSCYYEYGLEDDRAFLDVIAAVNADDALGVGRALLACCHDNGIVSLGLLYRRVEELLLYFTGNYGAIGTVQLWRGNPRTTKSEIYIIQDSDL